MRHKHESLSNRQIALRLLDELEEVGALGREDRARAIRIEAGVRRLLEIADPASMTLVFTERNTTTEGENQTMPIVPQPITLHAEDGYDISGATTDLMPDGTTPVTLTNLAFLPVSSAVAEEDTDANPADDAVSLSTVGKAVGATADLTFTADGSNGKKYEAIASVTVVADEVTLSAMTLQFTERVA